MFNTSSATVIYKSVWVLENANQQCHVRHRPNCRHTALPAQCAGPYTLTGKIKDKWTRRRRGLGTSSKLSFPTLCPVCRPLLAITTGFLEEELG